MKNLASDGSLKSTRFSAQRAFLTLAAVLIAILFLLPVAWLIASTFRSAPETFASANPLTMNVLWPKEWSGENIRSAIETGFVKNLLNSLIVAIATVASGLAVSAMAAFALAVIPFPGRSIAFSLVVFSFLIPFEATAIPLSRSFADWGLTDSLFGLILPGLGNGLAVFTLRQFFLAVPTSLAEAARIDGAGWFRIFFSIYLPLCRPALIGAGLILFLFQWQAYLWPTLVITKENLDVAPIAIAKAFSAFSTDYGRVFAQTTVLAIIPAAILLCLQKYFVTSLASTGGKE
ncbi:hypothetical protein N185_16500 [Sinorhizobium sp. GW3]|nr:hypothetical protein N185_16500 [Sinorhizobium sp. GW3]